ncbi:tyrosine-type recombinase/integrase [Methylobacterium radiodurans]|uniref:tyrosine-type recombinase/integrase n=1 Tax=Methylobacterium radiodurans TaxID=2202828 RepID=UPI0013A5A4E3|nr:tyrosine-type recombinase/integrase [Methylobacterium radiodurans]
MRYPITARGLATYMRRAIEKAGIKDLRPMHDVRHAAALTLRATGNLRLVQNLLGHHRQLRPDNAGRHPGTDGQSG